MQVNEELRQELEWFLSAMECLYGDMMYSTSKDVWYVEIVLDEADDASVVPALSSQHSDLLTAIRSLRLKMDELNANPIAVKSKEMLSLSNE